VFGDGARVPAGAAQVLEDGAADIGVEDEGDDAHCGAAAQAAERIDLEDAYLDSSRNC
jgi:hypothetical protein